MLAVAIKLIRSIPSVNQLIDRLYHEIVGEFWPPERRLVEDHYETLAEPFGLESHQFKIEVHWDLATFCSYLMTWSSSQRYLRDLGKDPLDPIKAELQQVWGPPEEVRQITFPIFLKLGEVHS